MALKTYVLLDEHDNTAPIFQRVPGNQRVKMRKTPHFRPFLQITFTDKSGVNKTIRYKENANSVYLDEQIKNGILANAKFTRGERDRMRFRDGVLTTGMKIAQDFLEITPENIIFEGMCDIAPKFKEYVRGDEIKSENKSFKKRLAIGNKIQALNLKQAQDELARLYGTFFKAPSDLDECQVFLANYMDECEDDDQLDNMLKSVKDLGTEEKISVLISGLIRSGVIEFDSKLGEVAKVKSGKKITLKKTPVGTSLQDMEAMFIDFLTSKDGEEILADLRKEIKSKSETEE